MSRARLNAEFLRSSGVSQTISSIFSLAKETTAITHCQQVCNDQPDSSWPEVEGSGIENALGKRQEGSPTMSRNGLGLFRAQSGWDNKRADIYRHRPH